MNEIRLSMTTNKLLAAAKADMPSAAARSNVWAGVSGAIGSAAGASGVTAATVIGGGGSKLLVIGTLLGGTVAVGIATALLQIGPAPASPFLSNQPAPAIARPEQAAPTRSPIFESISTAMGAPAGTHPNATADAPVSISLPAIATARAGARRGKGALHEDTLAREVSLVAAARSALGRADPRAALHAIRAARALPSKQLVPEELAVEAQALRALGQTDEANGIDVQLRLLYPEAALAR